MLKVSGLQSLSHTRLLRHQLRKLYRLSRHVSRPGLVLRSVVPRSAERGVGSRVPSALVPAAEDPSHIVQLPTGPTVALGTVCILPY